MNGTDVEVIEKLETEVPPPPPTEPTEKPEVPPAAEPPAESTPTEKPAEGLPEEPETEPDLETQPETSGDFAKYKPLFKEHPELRNILGREKAFSELGQFSEVRSIVERVPTLEDAETLSAQAETARTFGETFRTDPNQFVESLKESDPMAFRQLAEKLPEVLAETDPDAYTAQSRYYMTNTLDYLFRAGQSNPEFLTALGTVANALGISLGVPRATATVDPEKQKLRQQLAEREQQEAESEFQNFWDQTDGAIIQSATTEIESALKKALPTASAEQLDRMKKEAWAKTLETLQSQPQTIAQLDVFRKQAMAGKRGLAEHKSIVAYGTGRAKLIIPKAVKATVDEWTKKVLQFSNTTLEKKKAVAANTKDVGAGPQGTSASSAPAANPGKQRTQEDVFRELESRTYIPRK